MSTQRPTPVTADGVSLERAHLVGVGGAGMSGIARILADRGYAVSGSDARDSPMLAGLAARGVRWWRRARPVSRWCVGPTDWPP